MTGGCLEPKSGHRTRTKCRAIGWRFFGLTRFRVAFDLDAEMEHLPFPLRDKENYPRKPVVPRCSGMS